MTTETQYKNLPIPDEGQEDWDDELHETFNIIDTALKNVNENAISKNTATFGGLSVTSSASLDDNTPLSIGDDGDLSLKYDSENNESLLEDNTTDDIILKIPHNGGAISTDRTIHNTGQNSDLATESYADAAANSDGKDITPSSVATSDVTTDTLNTFKYLTNDMDESTVRSIVANASSDSTIVIEPGAQWTLTDTLTVPFRVDLHGSVRTDGFHTNEYTFKKGFNGTLATLQRANNITGVTFHGNKSNYSGDGVSIENRPYIKMSRVIIHRNAGDGLVFNDAMYWGYFEQLYCDLNDGWGIRYPAMTDSHYGQNTFHRILVGNNGAGGILYQGTDHTTRYNGSIFENGGPAIQFESNDFNMGIYHGYNQNFNGVNFSSNEGPIWLHKEGTAGNISFEHCNMLSNASNPDSSLTSPVGQFHIESGRFDGEIRGGRSDGAPYLYTAPSTTHNCTLTVSGAGNDNLLGDIQGGNTFLTMLNRRGASEGINVQSGIGLNPQNGGSVENY